MEARGSIIDVVKDYINKILSEVSGIKALILDAETMNVVSLLFPKSVMLSREVFLMELITNLTDYSMPYMKGIFLLRATENNEDHLLRLLKSPIFSEYYIYFTNVPIDMSTQNMLQKLAASDEKSIVKCVQEFYADFCVLNKELFTFDLPSVISLERPKMMHSLVDKKLFHRIIEGLMSVLLGTRKHPVIRYPISSPLCKRVAEELNVLLLTNCVECNKEGGKVI